MFFTSNESLEKINEILDAANSIHPNIKLVRQIGASISFPDLFIKTKIGVLTTLVYHKQAAKPYTVSFKIHKVY
jgi:hypothetical protein